MIERATKQPIQQFQLPTKNEVSQKRIQKFKDLISETLQNNDLSYFEPIMEQLASEHGTGDRQIAAALCYLLQQEAPFEFEESKLPGEFRRDDRRDSGPRGRFERDRDGANRSDRRTRDSGPPRERNTGPRDDSNMVTYRIEVGRNHDVAPSNIVGAIANSTGLEGRSIGRIELYDEYSTVDLPGSLPRELFSMLQNVHVKNRKIHIRPMDGEAPPLKKDKARGKPAGDDKKPAAPWQKSKPVRGRREGGRQ